LLLGALVLPWLFGLINAEIGAKAQLFRGRGWAIAALVGIVAWWSFRAVEHQRAVQIAISQNIVAPTPPDATSTSPTDASTYIPTYLPARAALASPDFLSPFRWSAVMDFGPVYKLAEIDTSSSTLLMGETTFPKPEDSPAIRTAERSKLGRAYIDWSPMPFLQVTQADNDLAARPDTLITFSDPRFIGGRLQATGRHPLVGTVELDAAGHIVRQTMDGRDEP
jgi:inner membrane protein